MSPIAHSGIALLGWELSATRKNYRTLALFLLVANFADIDFVFCLFLGRGRLSVHQYFTHNIFFVVASSALFSLLLPAWKDRWGLALVGLSHLALDIVVIDPIHPIGIRLFYPLSKRVLNFGIFPYLTRGSLARMLTVRNALVLVLESLVFLFPLFILWGKRFSGYFRRRAFWFP